MKSGDVHRNSALNSTRPKESLKNLLDSPHRSHFKLTQKSNVVFTEKNSCEIAARDSNDFGEITMNTHLDVDQHFLIFP